MHGCFSVAPPIDDDTSTSGSSSGASPETTTAISSGSATEPPTSADATTLDDTMGGDGDTSTADADTGSTMASTTGGSQTCPCPAGAVVCEDFEDDLVDWPFDTGGEMLKPKIAQTQVWCDLSSLYSSVTANDSSTISRSEPAPPVHTGSWSVGGFLWIDADCVAALDRVRLVELSFEVAASEVYWLGLNVGSQDTELQIGNAEGLHHNIESRTKITEDWFEFRIDFSFENSTAALFMNGVLEGPAEEALAPPPDLSDATMVFTVGTWRLGAGGLPEVCDVYHDQIWIAPTPV